MKNTFRIVLVCAALLVATDAHAATVLDIPLPALAARAGLVLRATVVNQKALWNDEHSAIVTHVNLRISEVLKGNETVGIGSEITMLKTGGVVGKVGEAVPGSAKFVDGEDVVVFLERAPRDAGLWVLSNMAASKFHVKATAAGNEQLTRDVSDLNLVQRLPSGRVQPVTSAPVTQLSLRDLRAIVRPAGK